MLNEIIAIALLVTCTGCAAPVAQDTLDYLNNAPIYFEAEIMGQTICSDEQVNNNPLIDLRLCDIVYSEGVK